VDALNELARISYIRCNYRDAVGYLEDARAMVRDNPRKYAQLTGNMGRIRVHVGDWTRAENELTETLEYNRAHGEEVSQAINLLSLGFLQLRQRKFILSSRSLDNALEIISRLSLKREKVIFLEYAGELAFEKGDIYKAKATLSNAYERGLLMAPNSALVSQSVRRLAEVELLLDNIDEAMRYGQKGLEASLHLGEKVEIGLAKRVIGQIFAARNDFEDALEYIGQAVELLRDVGDPLELARSLLVIADIQMQAQSTRTDRIAAALEEASKLFRELGLEYWVAETEFKAGVFACQIGDLATGFKKLSHAERVFSSLDDKVKVRAVNNFLKSLSEQAVALSISQENEFKVFGNLISPAEISSLASSRLDEILSILLKRTGGDRALIYSPDFADSPVSATFSLSPHQTKKYTEGFHNLLGEEISRSKPTLILDCRRDPFINGLFAESVDVVASVIVVPFKLGDSTTSYLYIDRLSLDNMLNPFSQTQLNFAVGFSDIIAFKWAEIQKSKLLEDNLRLKDQLREKAAFPNIITQNSDMLDILAQVRQVINSNISISIEGETGTGKDVVARAIHYNSNRRDKRFISVNCAALPETLLESELFGYKRGSFTGADRDKAGLFEEADGGTFFLDEIGDMPLNIQAKVLRVLEEKELVRLGETVPRKVDVRVISATNKDLKELMASGLFRQDLYYRLSALTFRLPSLRDRRDDIPPLVGHFLNGTGKTVSPDVLKMLIGYEWPGNVRELENEIKKLVLLSGDNTEITAEIVSAKVSKAVRAESEDIARKVESSDDIVFDENYSLYNYLEYHERRFIIKALREKGGVKKHAAELLGIPESTLRLKIKQYSIDLKNLNA
ncbi:MAG TPA: sigma 54-interacting transcriptional regulator, partial [candidate division Zixibacteria bacterium]|nr:sigma 54-interacting transcriptional regulator [candidate division Zixibacteria bacterium]